MLDKGAAHGQIGDDCNQKRSSALDEYLFCSLSGDTVEIKVEGTDEAEAAAYIENFLKENF